MTDTSTTTKRVYNCPRGHWEEAYGAEDTSFDRTCSAQDDDYGPGLCGQPMCPEVKVGDFFVSSWGYDQTNVDFYEVVGITASGKSIRVQPCRSEIVQGDDERGHSDRVAPIAGSQTGHQWRDHLTGELSPFVADPVLTKRLRPSSYCGWAFHVASYADAYLWDGKPEYQTASGWGH